MTQLLTPEMIREELQRDRLETDHSMNPEVCQKYGFKEWPGVIAMWVASSRTEQAERDRQGAALTDEELVLYDCFERARLSTLTAFSIVRATSNLL